MAVYNTSYVTLNVGSASVKGTYLTDFTTYVQANDLFQIIDTEVFYTVAAVNTASRLTLSSRYADTDNQTVRAENVASTNDATKCYSGTLSNYPVIQNYVVVEASNVRYTDDGGGTLTGTPTTGTPVGTIDYDTGAWTLTTATTYAASVNVTASYFSGDELTSQSYQVVRDFTPNYSMPEMSLNDTNFPNIYTNSVRIIDRELKEISDNVSGSYNTITATTLNASILNASGLLLNGSSAPLLTIHDNVNSGTGNRIVDIVPQQALGGTTHWTGIRINGAALDPSATSCRIRGIAVDMSGVDLTQTPEIDGLRVIMPNDYGDLQDDICAIHIEGNSGNVVKMIDEHGDTIHINGTMHQNYDASTITSTDNPSIHDIVINVEGATGGMVHAMDVARAGDEASGTVSIAAVAVHNGISPIHQHLGTDASACVLKYDGATYTSIKSAVASSAVNATIFSDDSDYVLYRFETAFNEIDVVLNTVANQSIIPTWEYSAGDWTSFSPSDDTDGMTQSGLIRFSSGALSGWAATTLNNEATAYYVIREQRTRNNLVTTPIEHTIKISNPTRFHKWDSSGNVNVLSVSASSVTATSFTGSYKSSDTSAGINQVATSVTDFDITIKDGIITSFTKN